MTPIERIRTDKKPGTYENQNELGADDQSGSSPNPSSTPNSSLPVVTSCSVINPFLSVRSLSSVLGLSAYFTTDWNSGEVNRLENSLSDEE
jgi:hypothetical protein